MRQLISTMVGRTATAFGWLASVTLVIIMTTTFVDVIGRTFVGRSLVGTVESVELLMGILVFSGLALTEINRRHIVVETFQALFPRPLKRLSILVNLTLAVVLTALLASQLIIKAIEIFKEQEHTQILEIPYWPTAFIMSAGIVLFLIVLLLRLFEAIVKPSVAEDTELQNKTNPS
ncbi:MAG: TRAP transporter small permease [Gammaproteobacteria bacterium]|nr:TRAP transporter small permease [Gammaproteobacteria bacterium]